jgi:hypothetical protein
MSGYNEISFIKTISNYEHEIIASNNASFCNYNFWF